MVNNNSKTKRFTRFCENLRVDDVDEIVSFSQALFPLNDDTNLD